MSKTAIILGASGLTGGLVLDLILKDPDYSHIKLLSRSKIEDLPEKVSQYVGDLLHLETFKEDFTADVVFCCIGTTKSKTSNKELYKKIDCGIPVSAAKLAKANGIKTFVVISAMGADRNSNVFYNKTKGEMEHEVLQQHIEHAFILRPSLIAGDRDENRLMEQLGITLFKLINPLLVGPLKNYKSIEPETIAKAMLYLAKHKPLIEPIITSNDIKEQLKK